MRPHSGFSKVLDSGASLANAKWVRRKRCGNHLFHSQGFLHSDQITAIDGIAVAQKISAPMVSGKRFSHLLHCPLLAGVVGQLEVQHAVPRMR